MAPPVFYVGIIIIVVAAALYLLARERNFNLEALEFIHIPKNAGTTIENVGNEKGVKWGRMKPGHRTHLRESAPHCTYWHVPPKFFERSAPYYQDPDGAFCVLRDPYARIVSEYKYRNPNSKDPIRMNRWIEKHLAPRYTKNGGLNCHMLPQHDFVYDDLGNKVCRHTLRFDRLTDDFNELTRRYDVDVRLAPGRKDNKSNDSLSVDDISEQNKRRIREVYAKDFRLLDDQR